MKARKTKTPLATIERIRTILNQLGMIAIEKQWHNFGNVCYSVGLAIMGNPYIKVNGKGATPEFALASAYAELMERIQNRMTLRMMYPDKFDTSHIFADEHQKTWRDLQNEIPEIIAAMLQSPEVAAAIPDTANFGCIPFYHPEEDRVVSIPRQLLYRSATSNGMCAGNTAEEAIVQGLGELLERHLIKLAIFTESPPDFPTIPFDLIPEDPDIHTILSTLYQQGLGVIIKDCTLGGRIPVLAAVVIHPSGRYIVRFGSDPVYAIALQRCLTEIFQGVGDNSEIFHLLSVPIDYTAAPNLNFRQLMGEHVAGLPFPDCSRTFFFSTQPPNFFNAFLPETATQAECLSFLRHKIKTLGYSLYIRDVSYLGFPAFQLYIPGMSEIQTLTSPMLQVEANLSQLQSCLLRLPSLTDPELEQLADHMKAIITDSPMDFVALDPGWFEIEADINKISDPDMLLSLIYQKLHRLGDAYYHLNQVLKKSPDMPNYQFALAGATAFWLQAQGITDHDQLSLALSTLTNPEIAQEILDSQDDPNVFGSLQLPNCPDCHRCPAQKTCMFNAYFRVHTTLINSQRIADIRQENIRNILEPGRNP